MLFWRVRVAVKAKMRPRRSLSTLYLISEPTEQADRLSLRVLFPTPWDRAQDVIVDATCAECGEVSVSSGALPRPPSGYRPEGLSWWRRLGWMWPDVLEYTVSVGYRGEEYEFSGVFQVPYPDGGSY
jgi:hypothetical protein